jgi:hypothetical protein
MGNLSCHFSLPCVPGNAQTTAAAAAVDTNTSESSLQADVKTLEAMIKGLSQQNHTALALLQRQQEEVSSLRQSLQDLSSASAAVGMEVRAQSESRKGSGQSVIVAEGLVEAYLEEDEAAREARLRQRAMMLQASLEGGGDDDVDDGTKLADDAKEDGTATNSGASTPRSLSGFSEKEEAAAFDPSPRPNGTAGGAENNDSGAESGSEVLLLDDDDDAEEDEDEDDDEYSTEVAAEEEERKAIIAASKKVHEMEVRTFEIGGGTIGLSFSSFSLLAGEDECEVPVGASILVTAVAPGGVAGGFGVAAGDLIAEFNGERLLEGMTKDAFFGKTLMPDTFMIHHSFYRTELIMVA